MQDNMLEISVKDQQVKTSDLHQAAWNRQRNSENESRTTRYQTNYGFTDALCDWIIGQSLLNQQLLLEIERLQPPRKKFYQFWK